MQYEKFQKRLALRQFGVGCNPQWLHNLMKEYDKPAYNPRSGEFPTALSTETEYKLTHVRNGDYRIDHKFYPRVKNTFNQLKPHGWKSEWGFGHNTPRKDIYVMRALQKQKSTVIATYTREEWEKVKKGMKQ